MDEAAFEAWAKRRRAGDETATLVNLYAMVAEPRGLQPRDLPAQERARLSARALYEMHPGFEVVPDSDRGQELIELVPYDPAWPARFVAWNDKLRAALGPAARRIDHVGSTSVPGLTAKPVIDIQVSVDDIRDESLYVPAVESLGVQLRSRDRAHRFFRPFAGRPRDIHLHVCDAGGEWERRHLLFVAYLRNDVAARDRYLRAKQSAFDMWADDRIAYTEAKNEVIREITERAEEWASATGWTL